MTKTKDNKPNDEVIIVTDAAGMTENKVDNTAIETQKEPVEPNTMKGNLKARSTG